MLGNSEKKMPLISSTTNQWPQNQVDDQKGLMGSRVMDKASQEQNQNQNHQQAVLKCPRCDSSNTKFCYYNNYSLSQPRHFCKACKRYWTRGGTLRNVPVGGGCRKNKRVIKRSSSSALDSNAPTISSSSSPTPTPTSNPNHNHHQILQNHINLSSNPLFYGLATNPSDLITHPYPSNFTSRVSNASHGFDLQSQLNGLGLGFDPLNKPMQGVTTSNGSGTCLSNPLLSSSYSLFGSSNYPTMASFLSSSLPRQQKFKQEGTPAATNFQGSVPYEDHLQQIMSRNNGEVKMEQASQKRLDWNIMNVPNFQNEIEAQVISSQTDPSLYWNHPTSFGGGTNWLDPPLNGSPAPSLI